jgi:spermidine synthase
MMGRLFAVSTAGSVFGALVTAYVSIPYLGVRRSLVAVAVVVLATALRRMWFGVARRLGIGVVLLCALAHAAPPDALGGVTFARGVTVLYSGDSRYAHIDVVEDTRDGSRVLMIDGSSQNWAAAPDWMQSLFDYVPAVWRHLERYRITGGRALVLGLGAGTLVRQMVARGFRVDVAEIDPMVADVATRYFAFDGTGTTVHLEDARAVLERLSRHVGGYDVIVFDAAGSTYHPDHVYNLEAYQRARDLLAPAGVVILNLVGPPDGRLIQHTGATLLRVFDQAEAFQLSLEASEPVSTVLFIGSRTRPGTAASVRPDERPLSLRRDLRPLSDDWNPSMIWAIEISEVWRDNNRQWLGDAAVIPW